jgi:hypothetical protein
MVAKAGFLMDAIEKAGQNYARRAGNGAFNLVGSPITNKAPQGLTNAVARINQARNKGIESIDNITINTDAIAGAGVNLPVLREVNHTFPSNLPVPVSNSLAVIPPAKRWNPVAWGAGIGSVTGGISAYGNDDSIISGMFWGGVKGAAVGGVWSGLRAGHSIDNLLRENKYVGGPYTNARVATADKINTFKQQYNESKQVTALKKNASDNQTNQVVMKQPRTTRIGNASINRRVNGQPNW